MINCFPSRAITYYVSLLIGPRFIAPFAFWKKDLSIELPELILRVILRIRNFEKTEDRPGKLTQRA
jgi:hypothetical protein